MFRRNKIIGSWLLSIIIFLFLIFPSYGQVPSPSPSANQIEDGRFCGNFVCQDVMLDGYKVLEVVALPIAKQTNNRVSVKERAIRISNVLKNIVNSEINPNSIKIEVATLNKETIIFIPEQYNISQTVIMTVTDLDAQYFLIPKAELARRWQENIRQALFKAYEERQLSYYKLPRIVFLGLGILIGSYVISRLKKLLHKQAKKLKDKICSQKNEAYFCEQELTSVNNWLERLKKWDKMSSVEKLNLNFLIRRSLSLSQLLFIMIGIATILYQFPQTRYVANYLFEKPMDILLIWLLAHIINRTLVIITNYLLEKTLDEYPPNSKEAQRNKLRIPTYANALEGGISFLSILYATIHSIEVLGISINTILTGAGLIGLAISLGAQNIVKDLVSGILILFTDQYAVGDLVGIGMVSGVVENMNLYITQLRSLDGELITIPNGSVGLVRNLSKDWSRVNFAIEVSNNSDLDLAMRIMKEVADEMGLEPIWKDLILEPAEVLGVDNVSSTGSLIRVLIKTKPLEQFRVGREFRYRVINALQKEGIGLGVPQQSLVIMNNVDNRN